MRGGEIHRDLPPLFSVSSLQHFVIFKNERSGDDLSIFK